MLLLKFNLQLASCIICSKLWPTLWHLLPHGCGAIYKLFSHDLYLQYTKFWMTFYVSSAPFKWAGGFMHTPLNSCKKSRTRVYGKVGIGFLGRDKIWENMFRKIGGPTNPKWVSLCVDKDNLLEGIESTLKSHQTNVLPELPFLQPQLWRALK